MKDLFNMLLNETHISCITPMTELSVLVQAGTTINLVYKSTT